jgi:hypothetical protein
MLPAEHITQFCLKCYNLCCDDRKTYELIQFIVTFCTISDLAEFSQIYIKMWCRRHPVSANIRKMVCKELVIMIALTCSVHTELTCVIAMVQQLLLSNRLRILFNDAFQCICHNKQPHNILNRDTSRKSERRFKRYIMFSVIVFGMLRPSIPVAARSKAWPLACWDCGFEFHPGHGCLSCKCCVLAGRGLCVGAITRPEESYRV